MNWGKEDREALLEDIDLLIMAFRDIAFAKEGLGDMALDKGIVDTGMCRSFQAYPIGKIHSIVENLSGLRRALAGYVNPKLAAQVLPGLVRG